MRLMPDILYARRYADSAPLYADISRAALIYAADARRFRAAAISHCYQLRQPLIAATLPVTRRLSYAMLLECRAMRWRRYAV